MCSYHGSLIKNKQIMIIAKISALLNIFARPNFYIMTLRLTIFYSLLLVFSCKNTNKAEVQTDEVAMLESAYKLNPTPESFNLLLQKLGANIMREEDNKKKEALIIKSIDLCKETKNTSYINTFAIELIKLNPQSEVSKFYLWSIADEMMSTGKMEVANVLRNGFADLYPNDVKSKGIKDSISAPYDNLNGLIKDLGANIFENPDVNGINKANSEKYVDVCESYALVYPNDSLSAGYLFKAAEMSRALKSYGKTISLYDWITVYHPNDKNAPMALFLKGFLLENDLKSPDKAKEIYQLFLSKYPNHAMAKDVNFLMSNIGKTDNELIEEIEEIKTPAK